MELRGEKLNLVFMMQNYIEMNEKNVQCVHYMVNF